MEVALGWIVPKVLGFEVAYSVHPYHGKPDLLNKLSARLRGYSAWMPPTMRIVVLVDRDDEDCVGLKDRIEQAALACGLRTRTRHGPARAQVVIRIVVEELEAWYLGDPDAIRAAYPRVAASTLRSARFADPDTVRGGTWEALERLLKRAGYHASGLPKIDVAHAIARHMNIDANRSKSFRTFVAALRAFRSGGR